ncbi:MAG: hypothetical protein A2Z97_16740 [Bdellovibrionales bacterium GWB1_52_6]|nr:MAG: hypothetical protein A2Z97_16740 [Bdellovibrionales bacterium GWB1_52_6]
MAYTDIVYPGGFDPKVERVYNSKTTFKGIFGWGWGTEYEVYLTVGPDGSVVVHEFGGGAENRFIPVNFKTQELDKAVEVIANAAKQTGAVGSTQQLEAYKSKLKSEAAFRDSEWAKYSKKLPPRKVPDGMQLHSNRFSYQYITKVQGGYVRSFDNGKVEKFNDQGKLVRILDKNGNFVALSYGKDGHLQKLVDNFNRKIFFAFNAQGTVEQVEGEGGKKSQYKYNALGELVYSKDVDGNIYTYKYDSARRHNMTEIVYSDKTSMQMAYHPQDKGENIKSVKDRDGSITEYGYTFEPGDLSHYSIQVKVKGSDGKQVSLSEYEYFMKTKATGEDWTYRMITTVDGDRTETIYNECCGLPVLIKRAGDETAFEYDPKGHVTKKTTPSEVTELSYDPKVNKINKVVRYSKQDKKDTNWSTFKYDSKGNLTFAKNSEGKGVQLFYDSNGRIKSLMDQSKRRIDFKYNENSKPVEITDPAMGTITVSYTNSGEIKKVESTAGRKVALQVTAAFQNLLDIIRPAGVNLSF